MKCKSSGNLTYPVGLLRLQLLEDLLRLLFSRKRTHLGGVSLIHGMAVSERERRDKYGFSGGDGVVLDVNINDNFNK